MSTVHSQNSFLKDQGAELSSLVLDHDLVSWHPICFFAEVLWVFSIFKCDDVMQISNLLTFLEVGHGPYYGDCRINIPSEDFYPVCEIFPDISQNSVSTKFQFIQWCQWSVK